MEAVLEAIKTELQRQDAKWGVQNHGEYKWAAILGEEVGEVNKAILEDEPAGYRKELIEVAAVAVQAVLSHDRERAGQ